MPQGTPVFIKCTEDDANSMHAKMKGGRCEYNFVLDQELRVQVRINKPLMTDFSEVYKTCRILLLL